jgi:hypothetical protein
VPTAQQFICKKCRSLVVTASQPGSLPVTRLLD